MGDATCAAATRIADTSTSVFFFQAEDGIRDWSVTGVQTCALPISYLDMMGTGSSYVGEGELARIAKICHNVMLGVVIQNLCEITVLAEKAGMPRHARSEERRVGKEGRSRGAWEQEREREVKEKRCK